MEVFICQVCGHIEFDQAPGQCPVCFAERKKFTQNNTIFEESREKSPEADIKHIPSISINRKCALIPEKSCNDILVRIGETLHPMEEKHFIRFIDCYINKSYIQRIFLTPEKVFPAACFHLNAESGTITIIENCNIHGYWMNEIQL